MAPSSNGSRGLTCEGNLPLHYGVCVTVSSSGAHRASTTTMLTPPPPSLPHRADQETKMPPKKSSLPPQKAKLHKFFSASATEASGATSLPSPPPPPPIQSSPATVLPLLVPFPLPLRPLNARHLFSVLLRLPRARLSLRLLLKVKASKFLQLPLPPLALAAPPRLSKLWPSSLRRLSPVLPPWQTSPRLRLRRRRSRARPPRPAKAHLVRVEASTTSGASWMGSFARGSRS